MGNVPSADKQEQSDSRPKKTKKAEKTKKDTVSNKRNNLEDDAMTEMTNVGGYSMLYSMAPDDNQLRPPESGEENVQGLPTVEQEKNKPLEKSPIKADSMRKSRKSSKLLAPSLKQEQIRSKNEIQSEDTNVGGYTKLYSIAPDEDQPKPPVTAEVKIERLPTVEQEKNKPLEKSPIKADSMRKSRKSSKLLAPSLKQEKTRSKNEIQSEDTNVGGYTMLYSIAPDDDQPKAPLAAEVKPERLLTVEQERNKPLEKSPIKADSMRKSRKSSKLLAPSLKQEKTRSKNEIQSEDTNVGGYTMLYSIAPDEDQPKPPLAAEVKPERLLTVEQERNKPLKKSPIKADSMRKSRKSSKLLAPSLKQEQIRSENESQSEDTNVGGYTMLYSIAPDDDQPKPPVVGKRNIQKSSVGDQIDSKACNAKLPVKDPPVALPIIKEENLHDVRASGQQVQNEIRADESNAGNYSVDKKRIVGDATTGILDALAPAKLNEDKECVHPEMEQKEKIIVKQIIESLHGQAVVAEPTGRRVMLMRNAERIDRTFPEWVDVSFKDKGKYKAYDLNQPLEIPERHDGYEAYRVDSPITELGNITAMMLGRAMKLGKHLPYKIFVSPAFRCIQTCHSFLKSVEDPLLSMQIEPALFEWLGWYETMPSWMEFSNLLKSNYKISSTYKPIVEAIDMKQYSNESVVDFYERCISAFRQILENDKKKGNILFIVHSTTIDAITRFLNGRDTSNVSEETLKLVGKNFPYSSVLIYEELADNTWRLMPDVLPSITYLDVSNRVNMDFLTRM
ncbi:Protein UBASH3A -like protein [Trichinella pseudospiralis]|uniref:Protein UBASH3A-like protein n=1 Tax=Trichinella pseudospiralis TaxID=6337 RepID=A0A0V1IHJ1_TRIPS|nr:Protein UBASH3A -like protein [Trichinella pseudospiralis]